MEKDKDVENEKEVKFPSEIENVNKYEDKIKLCFYVKVKYFILALIGMEIIE